MMIKLLVRSDLWIMDMIDKTGQILLSSRLRSVPQNLQVPRLSKLNVTENDYGNIPRLKQLFPMPKLSLLHILDRPVRQRDSESRHL